MGFQPQAQVTVGSDVVLHCKASTKGIGVIRNDRLVLSIFDKNNELTSCRSSTANASCTLRLDDVTHADAKMYFCVAKLTAGASGCSVVNKTLVVNGE